MAFGNLWDSSPWSLTVASLSAPVDLPPSPSSSLSLPEAISSWAPGLLLCSLQPGTPCQHHLPLCKPPAPEGPVTAFLSDTQDAAEPLG